MTDSRKFTDALDKIGNISENDFQDLLAVEEKDYAPPFDKFEDFQEASYLALQTLISDGFQDIAKTKQRLFSQADLWQFILQEPDKCLLPPAYFLNNDNFLSPQLNKKGRLALGQKALRQFVNLSLGDLNQKILKNILLQKDDAACKSYLKTLSSPKVQFLVPKKSRLIAKIPFIRQQSAFLLVRHLIISCSDSKKIQDFIKVISLSAVLSEGDLQIMQDFGFPLEKRALDSLKAIISQNSENFKRIAEQRIKTLKSERLRLLEIINRTKDQDLLQALIKAKGIPALLEILKESALLGNYPAWFNKGDAIDSQELAWIRLFAIKVAEMSPLGVEAHAKLFKAFKELSFLEKKHILKKLLEKKSLSRLLKADSPGALKSCWKDIVGEGVSAQTLQEIAEAVSEENQYNALLKAIHNAPLAKILSDLRPGLSLTAAMLDDLNRILSEFSLAIPGPDYGTLVLEIKRVLGANGWGLGVKERLDKALSQQEQEDEILEQMDCNYGLFVFSRREGEEKLTNKLLTLGKDPALRWFVSHEKIIEVRKCMRAAESAEKFLVLLKKASLLKLEKPVQKKEEEAVAHFLSRIENEFTSTVFHEIKSGLRAFTFAQEKFLSPIEEQLDQIKKSADIFDKIQILLKNRKEKLSSLSELSAKDLEELYDPTLENTASEEKLEAEKEQYQKMLGDFEAELEQLKRNKALFERDVMNLDLIKTNINFPAGHAKHAQFAELQKESQQLKGRLLKQLEQIEEDVGFYEKQQAQLKSLVIPAVESALIAKDSVYLPPGVSLGMDDNPVASLGGGSKVEVGVVEEGLHPHFKKVGSLQAGKRRIYEVKDLDAAYSLDPKKYQTLGSFAEEYKAEKVATQGYEVLKFPSSLNPKPSKEEKAALEHSLVNFGMVMADQMLSGKAGACQKNQKIKVKISSECKEEAAYIWTSVMILGQEMGLKAQDIEVDSVVFQPKVSELSWMGFQSSSLYETVFKAHASLVKEKKEDFKKLRHKRADLVEKKKEVNHIREDLEKSEQEGAIKNYLQRARDSLKEEGRAPESDGFVI